MVKLIPLLHFRPSLSRGFEPKPDRNITNLYHILYYNIIGATSSSFVEGGWYHTNHIGIIERQEWLSSHIKDTVVFHSITDLETYLQTTYGVTYSFLTVASYRIPDQETEDFIIFYSPTFDLDRADASTKLFATHWALWYISVKMIALPPRIIPVNQMEKATLGKLSGTCLLCRPIHQDRESGSPRYMLSDNFFDIGSTSINAILLMNLYPAPPGRHPVPSHPNGQTIPLAVTNAIRAVAFILKQQAALEIADVVAKAAAEQLTYSLSTTS
ncbi:hypothetical protein BDR07DRAFT_1500202 [Suillus spraguei]|nr:hypothetical protein BDR07DRAFT_1500202 [Suillus spraguei]